MLDKFKEEYGNYLKFCNDYCAGDSDDDEFFFSSEFCTRLDFIVMAIAEKNGREYDENYSWDIGGGVANISFPNQARIMEFAISAVYNEDVFRSYLVE